ncbi:hypothetical protein AAHH78_38110, partial [Burkholderia pseudomallei]
TTLREAPGGARNLPARAHDKVDQPRTALAQLFAGQPGGEARAAAAPPASTEKNGHIHLAGQRAFAPGGGDQAASFDAGLK